MKVKELIELLNKIEDKEKDIIIIDMPEDCTLVNTYEVEDTYVLVYLSN